MKISIKFILTSVLYGLLGMLIGMAMGITQEFKLAPVHAHLNLLGFMALAIYGLTFEVFEDMANSQLATIQYYIANIGLFLQLPALAFVVFNFKSAIPFLVLGEIITISSLILFLANILNFAIKSQRVKV